MTKELLIYAAQTVICGGSLYLLYRLLLERNPHHNVSRAYLMLSAVAAAIIPALSIPVWPAEPVVSAPQAVAIEYYYDYAAETTEVTQDAALSQTYTLYDALGALYAFAVVICLSILIFRLIKIRRFASGGVTRHMKLYRLVESDSIGSPFSFRRTIFLPAGLDAADRAHIILHESSHIRHRHSAELLLMELLKCIFWFNPFVWLMRRSLAEVHEYQADSDAIRAGSYGMEEYRSLIFRQLFGCNPDMASGLTSPTIKKRFIMMTNNKQGGRLVLRLLAILPVAAALTAIFGFTHRQAAPSDGDGGADSASVLVTTFLTRGEDIQPQQFLDFDTLMIVNATLIGADNPSPNESGSDSSLVIVNGVSTGKTWSDFLSGPKRDLRIDTIRMYKNASDEMIARYGEKAKSGIVLITTLDGPGNRPVELTTNVEIRRIQDAPGRTQALPVANDTDPVVLINGVPFDGTISDAVSSIDPEAIQRFAVHKKISDDLISKYGERAKNGILTITTFGGSDGVTEAEANRASGQAIYNSIITVDMPTILHQDARFRDCADIGEFTRWVEDNVAYPAEAKEKKIEGRVLVSFVVGKKGNVRNIEILESPHESMSDEVKRILKNSAGWVPGMVGFENKSQLMGSKFTIPVNFRLPQ